MADGIREMAAGSPVFQKVDPPEMKDAYDEEKQKEAMKVRPQLFEFNLVSQDNISADDQTKVKALVKMLADYFMKRDCTIHLYTVKQLGMIDICGIIPDQPGPMVPENNSYSISFLVTGPVGKIATDMMADFDKKLYIEVYDLCEYGAEDSVFNESNHDPDSPGQTVLFKPEDLIPDDPEITDLEDENENI